MLRGLLIGFCAVAVGLVSVGSAHAARVKAIDQVCKSTKTLPGHGYIYKNSAPLRSGGVGTPLVGYRKEPTLIGVTGVLSRSAGQIYDKSGKKIGSGPWAAAHDTRYGRYRYTMQTASLRRTARKNTGSPEIYIVVRGKDCVKVPDSGKCYGSVKGLCTQTIS